MTTRPWKYASFFALAFGFLAEPAWVQTKPQPPAAAKKPRIVGVEIKMSDKEHPLIPISQVRIPRDIIKKNGELHLGIEEARKAIKTLKDGDVLVFGVHSNPKGFMDGDKLVPWKEFWNYFRPGEKPPKLSNIVICGCMVHYPKKAMEDKIDPREIEPLRRYLYTESLFLPVEYYGWGHVTVAESILQGILDGVPLKDLESRKADKFHFINGPVIPPVAHAPGGLLGIQQKKESWYCTNRPNIGVQCTPAPQVKKGEAALPGLPQVLKSAAELQDQLKAMGINPASFNSFQDALLAAVRNAKSPADVPAFLRPPGLPTPDQGDPQAMRRWTAAAEASAAAWCVRVLSIGLSNKAGGPAVVRTSLKTSLNGRLNELKSLGSPVVQAVNSL